MPVDSCMRWLHVVVIIPVGEPANNDQYFVIFMKCAYLEELLRTYILELFDIGHYGNGDMHMTGVWVHADPCKHVTTLKTAVLSGMMTHCLIDCYRRFKGT
jgi:hypothetical protein